MLELNNKLVKDEKSSHYARYLLIIGILALSFSLSFVLRAAPLEYGFELNEFDPFFNYRATQFVVDNGLPAYLEWHDDLTWHPYGRDVAATSQVMLHASTAAFYQIFGVGSSLYDFTILFPVVASSLTAIVIFALVRLIGGTTAGLFASLFFAISPIIIMRGSLGWFKSEPLGLFYGLLAVYLLLSAIKSDKGKTSIAKVVGAGILLAFGLASWGGVQFFILPIGLFFIALPFLKNDNKSIVLLSVIISSVFFLITALFERTGLAFVSSLNGFFLAGSTMFLIACVVVKKVSNKSQLRNGLALLGGTIIAGITIASSGVISLPSFRYLNAANPFLIAEDMITDSVSEHATTTTDISFFFFSILMVFAGIGAWFLFQKKINQSLKIKGEMAAFALIIGFLGIYFSSAFVRLEVFGSISIIILSAIGVSILVSKILKSGPKPTSFVTKISCLAIIIALLVIPLGYPEKLNWSNNNTGIPITILNSGSQFDITSNDWPHALQWLKANTDEDDVIAAWWDYGYWISTLAERKTIADNATVLDFQIKKLAHVFMSTPDDAWKILTTDAKTYAGNNYPIFPILDSSATNNEERQLEIFSEWRMKDDNKNGIVNGDEKETWFAEGVHVCDNNWVCPKYVVNPGKINQYPTVFEYWLAEVYYIEPMLTGLDADYIIVNLVGEKLSDENVIELYTLKQKGGDETKAFWFMKISGLEVFDYYNSDLQGYTDKFWNETLLGQLIPLSPVAYVDPVNTEIQTKTYVPGYLAIYVKDVKFPTDGDGPFQLVYVPPSFERNESGPLTGPLIYKINKDYNINQ